MATEIKKDDWKGTDLEQHPEYTSLSIKLEDDTVKNAHTKLIEMKTFLKDDQFDGLFSCALIVSGYDFGRVTAVIATFFITDPRAAMAFKIRWA